ncbi:hypothetical protein HWV62_10036 [Athelia sp. TMB]|nr:hypothetical protein HWV62_11910 [Athelia sp. TMB]KAF7975282.1 hypothetical protein HWV62_10036 [Athelia sp. TMB]
MSHSDQQNLLRAEAELLLTEARKQKSERTKTLGDPIQLAGKALAICVRDGYAWIAENTTIARKLDLETGKTLQMYRGHTGPVTCLAFHDKGDGAGDSAILITGSWDQAIKLWDTATKECTSTTPAAHSDFVKTLFVIPSLQLLVSGGSDKIVRFWILTDPLARDLSTATAGTPLTSLGSISSHTRPVECLDGYAVSPTSAVLYTADTMGVIKAWDLDKRAGSWHSTLRTELTHHRTRINEMVLGNGQLWTASSDETVQILENPLDAASRPLPPLAHPVAVRAILPLGTTGLAEPYVLTGAGDIIRAYDVSSPAEPELLGEVDAHWHDVTALRLWVRRSAGGSGQTRVEPWVISASLDGTIRRWRLSELLHPPPKTAAPAPAPIPEEDGFTMTEEEERELAELLED